MIAETKGKQVVFFITVLRALAACLITNAHYTGIYPTDVIANGGLLGDVIFFAVSGYCLYNSNHPLSMPGFFRWYGKRIWRVYPPVIIMTIVFMGLGAYSLTPENGFVWWYVYPTYYHFVGSIIVLYIPYFFIVNINRLRRNIIPILAVIGTIWILVYCLLYDKTYYHIDTVREPMIRFLFMESMLIGAWFRQNDEKWRNSFRVIYLVITILLFFVYIGSKLLFSKKEALSSFQFLNQIAILALLFFIFLSACGLDEKMEMMPSCIKKCITFISSLTLEIYVVQYVIIEWIRNLVLLFPLNWLVLTCCILVLAFALHVVCKYMYLGIEKFVKYVYEGGGNT